MTKLKLEVVRFDGEDVIATSAFPSFFDDPDPLPSNVPTLYQDFLKLSQAEKLQLQEELGEDEYAALVLRLQSEYQSGATEFGGGDIP